MQRNWIRKVRNNKIGEQQRLHIINRKKEDIHTMSQENKQQENKMGVMPVDKLLISMSLPMMISMLVQALYNIVDSIFVAMVSEEALTAVSLAFPIQMLAIAVGAGTGVGVNAVLSKALGEKNYDRANKTADNAVFLTILSYLVFLLIGIFGTNIFFHTQTDNPTILQAGNSYLTLCMACSFGLFTQMTFERLLQSTGKTIYTMITQGTGAIINIILDPIMIFGLLGFPKLGVSGAALATVTGQIIAGIMAIIINKKKNHEIQICMKKFHPDRKIIQHIYAVGVPSIIMQAIGSITIYGMNRILIHFTATATAVLGVYYKLQSFFFMPLFGMNNGLVPIVAYNYGARKKERLVKAIKLSMLYAMVLMLAGICIFQIMPGILLGFFSASGEMLTIGIPALRIISVSFIFAGFCIICSSTFQALGNGVYSMLVSIARQLVVLLPAAYLLAKFGGLHLVWWAFPIAELMSLAMSLFFLFRIFERVIKRI